MKEKKSEMERTWNKALEVVASKKLARSITRPQIMQLVSTFSTNSSKFH